MFILENSTSQLQHYGIPFLFLSCRSSSNLSHCRYHTKHGHNRSGVCSNWLTYLQPSSKMDGSFSVPIFIQPANFHLPAEPQTPIIMIAAGTGIAPFKGFWKERRYLKSDMHQVLGPALLYFGC